jgi:dTDP-4-amino-4,6-dideoxygalactose transaminase
VENRIYTSEPNLESICKLNFSKFYEEKKNTPFHNHSLFENKLKEYLNTEKEVCVLSSGTAALHLSLVLAGVKENDIVFCSNSTYIATVNPILYMKALPFFIEINLFTGNMNMNYLEAAIKKTIDEGKKPKAIIITHSYGVPADINKLIELKKKYNLILIEDAAEALGSTYAQKYCGTLSDYGVFSFNSNKMNTTFGGGALIVKSLLEKKKIKQLSTHSKISDIDYLHNVKAYNYRMNDLAAYVGVHQMEFVKTELEQKKSNHYLYYGYLKNELIHIDDSNYESNYWLNCLWIKQNSSQLKEKIIEKLSTNNIEVRNTWYPLNKQEFLKDFECYGNNESLFFYNHSLCLPSSVNLKKEDILRIVSLIKEVN